MKAFQRLRWSPADSFVKSTRMYSKNAKLRRSYLYVPSSAERMLQKSLMVKSDVTVYDLEDSIAPNDKDAARRKLSDFLERIDSREQDADTTIAVRVNDISTPFFEKDMAESLKYQCVQELVIPKLHNTENLDHIDRTAKRHFTSDRSTNPLKLVPSIESAQGMFNIGRIAAWQSNSGTNDVKLTSLLFAAEDYCADTSIIRTPSRLELLYTRSQIVISAKAFGLQAIDLVCINYKDINTLKSECEDGRRMGFTGKQAIHPSQVMVINNTFVPTEAEILRAAKIVHSLERAHTSNRGAVGLEGEMIDAPMLKQAQKTIDIARAAGLTIPLIE